MDGPGATTVYDHPFEPKGEWWSCCRHCNLAEASHVFKMDDPPATPPPAPPRPTDSGGQEPDDEALPFQSTHDINMLDGQYMVPPKEDA